MIHINDRRRRSYDDDERACITAPAAKRVRVTESTHTHMLHTLAHMHIHTM